MFYNIAMIKGFYMDKQLLEILACPRCHGDLILKQENNQDTGLICNACALLYPIEDEIPIMLIEKAKPLEKDDKTCASS